MSKAILVIHGGAGRLRPSIVKERSKIEASLKDSLKEGFDALKSGNALDAVEAAVRSMESSGVFNAGRGAALNLLGEQERDAGIMDGRDLSYGAVASLKFTWNAVSLARKVMEKTDHVLVVGAGADRLAEVLGFEKAGEPSTELQDRYLELMGKLKEEGYELWRRNFEVARAFLADTVGAVALDKDGNLAAATSTGGLWLKLPGRVGDTPLPGAGVYAENGLVAVSATGIGELISRYLSSIRVAYKVKSGIPVDKAVKEVVVEMTSYFGQANTVGLIAVDSNGRIGLETNCEVFLRGFITQNGEPKVAVLAKEALT